MTKLRVAASRYSSPDPYLPLPFQHSRFGDSVWTAKVAAKAYNKLNWDKVVFADGTRLLDLKHTRLLRSCKTFLVLHAAGTGLKKRTKLKGGSVLIAFTYLMEIVRWMYDRHGIRLFSGLTIAHLVTYRNHARRKIIRGATRNKGQRSAPASQEMRLMYLRYLIEMSSELPDGTRVNVYEALKVLRAKPTRAVERTERIGDDTFIALMNEALRWVRDIGPVVVTFWRDLQRYRNSTLRDWKRRGRELKAFSFVPFRTTYARPCIVKFDGQTIDLRHEHVKSIRELFTALTGACYILISGSVGMRVSEALDIPSSPLITKKLRDGRRLLKIWSTLHKTSKLDEGEPAEWVAGWDEPSNPVRLAVNLLQEMFPNSDYLFSSLTTKSDFDKRLAPPGANYAIRHFAELVKIRTSKLLATHQFRKTFARFVALSAPGAAGALQRQFKHISIQMTERYFPNDPDLIEEIVEASLEIAEERYEAILSADTLGGMMGQEILLRNTSYRGPAAAKKRREAIKLALLDPHIRPVFHIYGVCLYDAHKARCEGKIENVGIDMCSGCQNLAVELQHLPIWEEHAEGLQSTIAELASLGAINLELERQFMRARKIIQQLRDQDGPNTIESRRASPTKAKDSERAKVGA